MHFFTPIKGKILFFILLLFPLTIALAFIEYYLNACSAGYQIVNHATGETDFIQRPCGYLSDVVNWLTNNQLFHLMLVVALIILFSYIISLFLAKSAMKKASIKRITIATLLGINLLAIIAIALYIHFLLINPVQYHRGIPSPN
jgi:hypothetical protein